MAEKKEIKTGELKQPKKTAVKEKKFLITFRGNRKFELYIGRKYFIFNGRESKEITEKEYNHPHFKAQLKYFAIKGV